MGQLISIEGKRIQRYKISKNRTQSHLFFVNDVIVFGFGTVGEAKNYKEYLI